MIEMLESGKWWWSVPKLGYQRYVLPIFTMDFPLFFSGRPNEPNYIDSYIILREKIGHTCIFS